MCTQRPGLESSRIFFSATGENAKRSTNPFSTTIVMQTSSGEFFCIFFGVSTRPACSRHFGVLSACFVRIEEIIISNLHMRTFSSKLSVCNLNYGFCGRSEKTRGKSDDECK